MQHVQRHGSCEKAQEIGKTEVDALIDEWIIGRNAERNRKILRRRLFDGITYEALAEEFEMSVRQIKYIVYKSEERIFSKV